MVIAKCIKCKKPIPDSYHDYEEICDCIDWRAKAKRMGWNLRFPED